MFRQDGSTACLPQPPCDRDPPGSAARSVVISWFFLKKVFPYIETKSFFWSFYPRGPAPFFLKQERRRRQHSCIHFTAQVMSQGGHEDSSDSSGINPSLSDSKGLTHRCHPILGQHYESQLGARASGPRQSEGAEVQPVLGWKIAWAKTKENISLTHIVHIGCGPRRRCRLGRETVSDVPGHAMWGGGVSVSLTHFSGS